ncbi:MAG: hypothetical protein KQH57_05665 [Actinomycetales bacterium]|nr:hypothetical protein [Actinomycetales bacterium]
MLPVLVFTASTFAVLGLRPHYRVAQHHPLRHPEHRRHEVDELTALLNGEP